MASPRPSVRIVIGPFAALCSITCGFEHSLAFIHFIMYIMWLELWASTIILYTVSLREKSDPTGLSSNSFVCTAE